MDVFFVQTFFDSLVDRNASLEQNIAASIRQIKAKGCSNLEVLGLNDPCVLLAHVSPAAVNKGKRNLGTTATE